jgi:GntR family transcriptional regulator/MocR family aminotransferase
MLVISFMGEYSNYLKLYRNINCDANQIIITSGSLHSLYLISNTLIDENDEVIIENPSYPNAYSLFKSLNANIHPIDIDNEGISVKKMVCENPKFIYTTPSNQYPSGVKMSMRRRLELLEWASSKSTYLIEDDYNHEFSNWENPIASVFSLDQQERTIYLGTFNKLLHPSIRLGYMIVPHHLVNVIKALYEQSSRFVSTSLQKTLSNFIEKGYLNKHLRHIIEVSVERKQLFLDCFNQNFNNEILLDSNNTGLHLTGKLKDNIKDVEIANYLSQNGIITHPLSNYYVGKTSKNGLVMGYCSVNNKLIKENINKMVKVYGRFLIS